MFAELNKMGENYLGNFLMFTFKDKVASSLRIPVKDYQKNQPPNIYGYGYPLMLPLK